MQLKVLSLLAVLLLALPLAGQVASKPMPDPQLMNEINQLKAIDNHAHPPAFVTGSEKDTDFDALPCDPLEPTASGLMWREDNPIYLEAWKSLWGYKYNDAAPEHVREVLAAKQKMKQQQGENYPNWVLDQLGIETELANRIALGRGQAPPRFRWVPFDDTLLFPLNNTSMAAQSPDRKIFFAAEGQLFQRYLKQLGVSKLPATLEEYESSIVTPLLELQRKNGAVAIKFEAAYLRSLDFEPASRPDAARIYALHVKGDAPNDADYKILQDYLFRYVAREAGRLNLAVHFHTGAGCGGYFDLRGSNPLLLESVFDDPSLRSTNFVMVHAGSRELQRRGRPAVDEAQRLRRHLGAAVDDLRPSHGSRRALHVGVVSRESALRDRPVPGITTGRLGRGGLSNRAQGSPGVGRSADRHAAG